MLNKWHCTDCLKESLVEVDEHGGMMVHCCFFCGSSRKTYKTMPFIIGPVEGIVYIKRKDNE